MDPQLDEEEEDEADEAHDAVPQTRRKRAAMVVARMTAAELMAANGHQTIVPKGKQSAPRLFNDPDKKAIMQLVAKPENVVVTRKGSKRVNWDKVVKDWDAQVEAEKLAAVPSADRISEFVNKKTQKASLVSLHQRLGLAVKPPEENAEEGDGGTASPTAAKKEKKAGKKRKGGGDENAAPSEQQQQQIMSAAQLQEIMTMLQRAAAAGVVTAPQPQPPPVEPPSKRRRKE